MRRQTFWDVPLPAVWNSTKITKQLLQYKEMTDVVNQRIGQEASHYLP